MLRTGLGGVSESLGAGWGVGVWVGWRVGAGARVAAGGGGGGGGSLSPGLAIVPVSSLNFANETIFDGYYFTILNKYM